MASFRRASRLLFQHFLQMVNIKVRQLRRDWWACLDSSLDKNTALHVHRTTFVWVLHHSPSCCQLALVLGRTDDTGLSRTYVPTNPGELRQCTGNHFTKRSCWWLVLWVHGDMQAGVWTRYRSTVCSIARGAVVSKTEVRICLQTGHIWSLTAAEVPKTGLLPQNVAQVPTHQPAHKP